MINLCVNIRMFLLQPKNLASLRTHTVRFGSRF